MAVQDEPETVPAEVDLDAGAPRKAMTIGAVCKALEQDDQKKFRSLVIPAP